MTEKISKINKSLNNCWITLSTCLPGQYETPAMCLYMTLNWILFLLIHRSQLRPGGAAFAWRLIGGDFPSCSEVTDCFYKPASPSARPKECPDSTTVHRLYIEGAWSYRKRERENKHSFKKTLFMNSPKTWKANTASWLAVLRRHVDNEHGLALCPSLHCPPCWLLSYSCHGRWCHSTPRLLLQ